MTKRIANLKFQKERAYDEATGKYRIFTKKGFKYVSEKEFEKRFRQVFFKKEEK